MSDLLRPLLDTIETARERINLARSTRGWNEAQTRASLIDPILTVLGWDTADPTLVRHEVISSGGRADYTLLESEDHLVAIVEAKPLGDLLAMKKVGQTTNYANHAGAPYAVLTNGDRWVLYEVFKQAKIEERLLLDVTVSSADTQATALGLLELWRPRISSRQRARAERPTEPEPVAPEPVAASPTSRQEAGWIPLDNVPQDKEHQPLAIRFEDGFEWPTPELWSITEGAIVWLHRREALSEQRLPVTDKKGNPVIHTQSEAASVHSARPAGDAPFVCSSHGTAKMQRDRFKDLLHRCGHSAASVLAKPRK